MAEGRVVAEKVHQGQEEASFCPVGQDKPHPQGNGCEAQPDDGENVDTGDHLFQGNGQGTSEDDCGQGKAGPSEFCWKHACSRNMCLPGGLWQGCGFLVGRADLYACAGQKKRARIRTFPGRILCVCVTSCAYCCPCVSCLLRTEDERPLSPASGLNAIAISSDRATV